MNDAVCVPVTVIIPCYKAAETVDRAVESVMSQTTLPSEIILIDDASPDNGLTVNALQAIRALYAQEMRISLIRLPKNGGPSVARNAGWDAATEPYIAFLDSDDAWHPRKLAIQYRWMADRPEVAMSGHRSVQPGEGSDLPVFSEAWTARRIRAMPLLLSNRFPTRSVMLRRDLEYRFSPNKRRSEDYLLWLQIVTDGNQAWFLDAPLAFHFKPAFGERGLSAALWDMEKEELGTYRELWRSGRIGRVSALLLSGYSLTKHCRRWALTRVRKWASRS